MKEQASLQVELLVGIAGKRGTRGLELEAMKCRTGTKQAFLSPLAPRLGLFFLRLVPESQYENTMKATFPLIVINGGAQVDSFCAFGAWDALLEIQIRRMGIYEFFLIFVTIAAIFSSL